MAALHQSKIEESAWVAEVEAAVADRAASAEESARWRLHSIYRVPACIKDLNRKAYQPQVVSLGPFHHGEPQLLPMDAHKRRALVHFLRRARRPLAEFAAAVAGARERLEGAYQGLGDEWRGGERFVELMVTDGCFLLEVMRTATGWEPNDYAGDDPVFSAHGLLYTVPYIRRDMLMIENQLPLLVLERLLAVESGKDGNEELINRLVLLFLSPAAWPPTTGVGLALHPLDILRRSLLYGPSPAPHAPPPPPPPPDSSSDDTIRSAEELYEAGVRFKRSPTSSLLDIRFHRGTGTLHLPAIAVDDTTEYMLLNLMALERLHHAGGGGGNEVTAYVFFMDNMVDSARDVALLAARRVVRNALGSDKAVARLFNGLSRDVVLEPTSALDGVHREVSAYCRRRRNRWRANLVHTYFRSPWSFMSLAAAVFLLVMTVLQTVYTVMPYYDGKS
ncbi:unnamed protein product [Urochloa humidicola]